MLSVYRNSYDTTGTIVTLEAIVERILDGKRGLDEKTRMCNVLASTAPKAYKTYKESLPAVTFAGMFPKGKRRATSLLRHSGYAVLDIDGLLPSQIPELLAILAQHPYVLLAFVSPSGKGIKVVVRVSPVPTNDAEHKTAWQACVDFFENEAEEHGFEIDPSGKDCSRLCFLAHDPQAIIHSESTPITWDPSNIYLHTSDLSDYTHSEADTSSLHTFLKSQDITILGTRQRGGFFVECLNRAEHTGAKHGKTDSFIRLCENGLIYHCSHSHCADKKSGWFLEQRGINRDPFRKTPERYHIDAAYRHHTSNINAEQEANQTVLTQWIQDTEEVKGKHLLILGSAAGTGKTTAAVTTADGLLYIAKTTEEADNVFDLLNEREEDVIRHRSRMFNRDHENWNTLPLGLGANERPCIKPELCNLHAQRLGTPNAICQPCPLYAECKASGYLSQAERERNASKVVCSWNEEFACDEIFAGRVKRICTKDKILAVDEVNPLGLTQKRYLDRDMLFDLAERFRHPHEKTLEIYKTLKSLLDLIATTETSELFIEGIRKVIDGIDDISETDEKIEKYPIGVVFSHKPPEAEHNQPFVATLCYQDKEVTVPVVDGETAPDTAAFFVNPDVPIAVDRYEIRFVSYEFLLKVGIATLDEPPIRHRKLLRDLEKFFRENNDLTTAPGTFDPKKQAFEFHLAPTLNHRRVIFNTASDPDNLIGEAYRDTNIQITQHTGQTPAWKDPLAFQLSGGNYFPRQSLLKCDGKVLSLKPRAQEMVDRFIVPSIKSSLKVLVVAPKAFQDIDSVSDWATHDMKQYKQGKNALLINHHHAEGRNDYQDFDIAFIFHYEPSHWEIQAAAKRIYRKPKTPLDFTREKRTVTVGSVSFQKNVYVDKRVQAVYNRECRQRLMQSAMRLRPNIHEGKIIVFLTAEPVDIPVTPIPFTVSNAGGFDGNWTAFVERLQETDVQNVMKRDGVGEWTARKRTKPARDQHDASRDKRILELNAEKISQREIERILKSEGYKKASRKVISRVVQNGESTIINTYNKITEMHHPQNPVPPCLESNSAQNGHPQTNGNGTHTPVPQSEYSKLTEIQAHVELKYCEDHDNFDGAAYLRNMFKNKGWELTR